MPHFDEDTPLKRGQVIGRGRGPCTKNTPECDQEDITPETWHNNETDAQ
jgi:hypothetical protein